MGVEGPHDLAIQCTEIASHREVHQRPTHKCEERSKAFLFSPTTYHVHMTYLHDSHVPDNVVSKTSASRGDRGEAPASIERFV